MDLKKGNEAARRAARMIRRTVDIYDHADWDDAMENQVSDIIASELAAVPSERDAGLEEAAKLGFDEVVAMDGKPYSTLQKAACVAARIRSRISVPAVAEVEPHNLPRQDTQQ